MKNLLNFCATYRVADTFFWFCILALTALGGFILAPMALDAAIVLAGGAR